MADRVRAGLSSSGFGESIERVRSAFLYDTVGQETSYSTPTTEALRSEAWWTLRPLGGGPEGPKGGRIVVVVD